MDHIDQTRLRAAIDADPLAALPRIQQRAKAGEPDAEWYFLLGLTHFRLKHFHRAATAFMTSAALVPTDARALYYVGLASERAGDLEGAARAYRLAHKTDPTMRKAAEKVAALPPPPVPPAASTVPPATGPVGSSPGPPPAVPPVEHNDDDESETSLSRLLDDEARGTVPRDAQMAGEVLWQGRPSALVLVQAGVLAAVALLLPLLLRFWIDGLSAGYVRIVLAGLWRILDAFSIPVAVIALIVALCRMISTWYVIREHRIEVSRGIVYRKYHVVWLHDVERPPYVTQSPLQLIVGAGSVVFRSTILAGRGKLVLFGLPIHTADHLAAIIRAHMLWQRRRMLKNFVSSR